MMSFGPIWMVLIGVVLLAILAFEVWMFVDVLQNPRLNANERILWCLAMILLHPFVAIVYYFSAYSNKTGA